MKSFRVGVLILALSTAALAVDGRSLLIGISIGLGLSAYQGTRQHVILPVAHAVQRAVRPIPQDKIDRANRKAAKRAKKLELAPKE